MDELTEMETEIEKKRYEIEMLRLEITEHNIRKTLDWIKRPSKLDDGLPYTESTITGNLRDINTQQHKQIDEKDSHIDELNLTLASYREQNIRQYNKLNDIQNVLGTHGRDCISLCTTIDEIAKIIQE